MKKLDMLARELKHPDIFGPKDAAVTIIAAGSTKGPIKEAMIVLEKEGVMANYLQITTGTSRGYMI